MSNMKSRKFMKFFVGLVVLGMIILVIPLQSVFGDSGSGGDIDLNDYTPETGSPAGCCTSPGGNVLKWDDNTLFDNEKFWEVDVSDPMGTYSAICDQGYEPKVIGVCVKTGGLDEQLFEENGGSNDHVTVVINGSYASVTEKVTTGDGGDVSHICIYYSCVEITTCEGSITVVKKVGGNTPTEDIGTFSFYIQKDSDTADKYDLNFANSYSKTIDPLDCGNYKVWEDESSMPAGYEFSSIQTDIGSVGGAGNKEVSFTMTDDGSGIITINNSTEEDETGSITICKTYTGEGDPPDYFNFTVTGPGGYNNSVQVVPDGDCVTLVHHNINKVTY
jgi:hypothetical protein